MQYHDIYMPMVTVQEAFYVTVDVVPSHVEHEVTYAVSGYVYSQYTYKIIIYAVTMNGYSLNTHIYHTQLFPHNTFIYTDTQIRVFTIHINA